MVKRVTYRRKTRYNTLGNKFKLVKTPGGRLVMQYLTKIANGPQCKETGKRLSGIQRLRPKVYGRLSKRQNTVTRAYGGTLSHSAVKERVIRAFLTEEVKVIKRKSQEKKK